MGSIATPTAPKYGQRLLPTLVDDLARDRPDKLFVLIPKSKDLQNGFHEVTYSTLAQSVNAVALWLERTVGRSQQFETIAYIGAADLRYYLLALAAAKVGLKTLFPSTRNTSEGTRSLLEKTQCHTLITSAEVPVEQLLQDNCLRHIVIDSLPDLLSKKELKHYDYSKSFEDAKNDPFIVIHTSGSTGLPKPITLYHGGVAAVDAHHNLGPYNGQPPVVLKLISVYPSFETLPPFHMGGILCSLAIPLYYEQTILWPPAGRPVSVDLVEDILDNVKIGSCVLPPSILEEMSQSQASLDRLRKLEYAAFGGGPLAKTAGDTVSQYTRVRNIMGSSESDMMPTYDNSAEDWQSFHYNPGLEGIKFEHVDGGLYEQIIVRSKSTDPYHSTWYTFPDQDRYATHDLYAKHPSKENMWLYAGRSDDVIVLSNGEKLNPNAMESVLRSHPDVKGALVLGQARFEPGALIELRHGYPQSSGKREALRQSFQPHIDKANDGAPAYGKLRYDHVIFAKPEKPMLRADKGTVKRLSTLKLYEQEINDFYDEIKSSNVSTASELNVADRNSLMMSLKPLVEQICKMNDIDVDEDLFGLGIDSLQVMTITRQLKSGISSQNDAVASLVSPKFIYSNPSLRRLASAIFTLLNPNIDGEGAAETTRIDLMKQMVQEFSDSLLPSNASRLRTNSEGLTVVLTGSSGSLGSYILDDALARPEITKIICLNRSADSESRQRSSHASKGLAQDWQGKVNFLQADLSKPQLGLDDERYNNMLTEANLIIHNQWQVDFNLALSSFKPHIAGVRNLIDLSAKSAIRPSIIFTSSISTLGHWSTKHPNEKVPEAPLHDYSIPAATGYGESKFIAERILENAAQRSGVPSATVRVGQLAGPVIKDGGQWNRKEWLPSLITSSSYLNILPRTIPTFNDIAWIPCDLAAKALLDLSISTVLDQSSPSTNTSPHHTFNLLNPNPSSWSSLLPTIAAHLCPSDPQTVQTVDYSDWVARLRASASTQENELVAKNPAVKLLDFYESLQGGDGCTVLQTSETAATSETVRALKGVGPEWMGLWLRQWGF
ncbi:MAG: hypothetical protein L6R36_008811 [Xanthoria steineri]|nr:MAG: hypothetical protein L6R36_008811 [Xanthoria steineri]